MSEGRFLTDTLEMNSGHEIPKEGYGTWLTPEDEVAPVVVQAMECGYRLIDTAHDYNNEKGVGDGIHLAMDELGLKREDFFVTTKVNADVLTAEEAKASVDESLNKLRLDYVDLILIHAPRPWKYMDAEPGPDGDHFYGKNRVVWGALERAVNDGYTKSIGLSQFSPDDMNHLMETATIMPALLQTEAYAGNLPRDLMQYCASQNIVIQAFCPLGHGRILQDETLKKIAGHYATSTSQLCLKYLIQNGFSVIPKSMKLEHIKDNTDLNFTIDDADLNTLDQLDLSHALDGL